MATVGQPLLQPILKQVSKVENMQIGDCISCKYTATSGQVGIFSELGVCSVTEIPTTSSATPDGKFYFIMVGYDSQGRKKLVADRNIQHSISWDTLNSAGICSGLDISKISNTVFNDLGTHVINYYENGNLILDSSDHSSQSAARALQGKSSGKWYFEVFIPTAYYQSIGVASINASTNVNMSSILPTTGIRWYEPHRGCIHFNNVVNQAYTKGDSSTNQYIGVALDMDKGTIEFFKNNISQGVAFTDLKSLGTVYPFMGLLTHSPISVNFGTKPFKYDIPKGFLAYDSILLTNNTILRLLTGGVSTTDKDNEWDRVICESNLANKITPGDNNVWHWNGTNGAQYGSWCSNSPSVSITASSSRTLRGSNSNGIPSLEGYNYGASSMTSLVGFRPVLLVEPPLGVTKYLLQWGSNIYNISTIPNTLAELPIIKTLVEGQTCINVLTKADIDSYGSEDLNKVLQAKKLFPLGSKYKVLKFKIN